MFRLIGAALFSFLVASASAQAPKDLPAPLALAVQSGMAVEQSFPAASGLTGWLVRGEDGKHNIVFTTADRQTLVAGALIDASGRNLTADYAERYIPKPDFDKFLTRLESAFWFADGASGPDVKSVVYAFLDPNCVFCNLAWQALTPYKAHGLQVRWVPVAFLREDSAGKVAAIVGAKQPSEALAKHEASYRTGGIAPAAVSADLASKLKLNAALMREMGFEGTPAFVWKDPRTGKAQAKGGMVRLSEIPGMTGLAAQKNTNPDLARFAD